MLSWPRFDGRRRSIYGRTQLEVQNASDSREHNEVEGDKRDRRLVDPERHREVVLIVEAAMQHPARGSDGFVCRRHGLILFILAKT